MDGEESGAAEIEAVMGGGGKNLVGQCKERGHLENDGLVFISKVA